MYRRCALAFALIASLIAFSGHHVLPAHAATSAATTPGYTVLETGPDTLTAGVPATYTVTFTALLAGGLSVDPTVTISAGANAITIANSSTIGFSCTTFTQAASPVTYSSLIPCTANPFLSTVIQPTITLTITLTPTGAGSVTVSAAEPINSAGTLVSLTTPLATTNTGNFPATTFRSPSFSGANFDPRCTFGCGPFGLP